MYFSADYTILFSLFASIQLLAEKEKFSIKIIVFFRTSNNLIASYAQFFSLKFPLSIVDTHFDCLWRLMWAAEWDENISKTQKAREASSVTKQSFLQKQIREAIRNA